MFDEKCFFPPPHGHDHHDCEHDHHHHPHKPEPPMTPCEEDVKLRHDMRACIDRLIRFEERLRKEMDEFTHNISKDNVIFKDTYAQSFKDFSDAVAKEINDFEKEVLANYSNLLPDFEAQITRYIESTESAYNAFVEAINSRLETYNENHSQAFADYQRKLQTEINMFEATVNTNFTTFTESLMNTVTTFKDTWETVITERLREQDAKVSDAEMYMKTNLGATIATMIGDMYDRGDFADIIEGEVFANFSAKTKRIKTPEMYGAVGNGVVNDTEALERFTSALVDGDIIIFNGTYLVDRVRVTNINDLHVHGMGGFILSENADLHAIEFNGCNNLIVDHLHIDGANRTARALNIYNVNGFEIRNAHIHDVGSDTADNSIYGIIVVNSHNGRIVNAHINYVHAVSVSTGINMESDGADVKTTPTNIVIDGALIENIFPVADGDGVKVLGTIESNITVMNSVFKNCAKRSIKFQSIGCTSFNNKFYGMCGYAHIDFQRKNGKSINDTFYIDVPESPDFTGIGYYGICCDDNTVIDGLNVHVKGDDSALYGACTSSNLIGVQNLGGYDRTRVTIRNCKIDAWGYFLKYNTNNDAELVIENNEINRLYMNALLSNGTYETVVFKNNRLITAPKSWFVFCNDGLIAKGDIDLTGVMRTEWNTFEFNRAHDIHVVAHCATSELTSGSFVLENGRMTFTTPINKTPQNDIYSSGKWFRQAKVGDVCYLTTPNINGDTVEVGWICVENPSDANITGVWKSITM